MQIVLFKSRTFLESVKLQRFDVELLFLLYQGAIGVIGAKGETGSTGPRGRDGKIGPQGPQGSKGQKGSKGEKGEMGVRVSGLAYSFYIKVVAIYHHHH